MKKYLEILKKCPLFYGIEPEGLGRILNCLGARVLSFDKKEVILSEGTSAHNIGILLSGSLTTVTRLFLPMPIRPTCFASRLRAQGSSRFLFPLWQTSHARYFSFRPAASFIPARKTVSSTVK